MTDFKVVPLSEIHPDPNQPRKFYDDAAMAELTQSVKEKGVLQPILIRPNGNGYSLVCGERRYRASTSAGLEEIPAVIRELTDEEALELQIIENLQRKDVHPMEEAVAFKSLMEGKQWSIQEVATRIGKKDFYIRQRLKLNELIPEWQKLFYNNRFTLGEALEICMLPEKAQSEFYKNEAGDDRGFTSFNSYRLAQYKGDLHKATFDLNDPTLDRKMGPCTTCQFNTAVSLLFPENANSPRCMNVPCFKHKGDVFFDRELKIAKEDPAIVLVRSGYNSDKVVEQLKKEGHQVLKDYDDFREMQAPEKLDWEEYKEENFVAEEGDDLEEVKVEFEKELVAYEKEKAAFDKKIATGKYKKAFEVSGYHPGKYTYIELKATGGQKASKEAIASGDASAADIDSEITRIKDREKRAKELDAEKVHVIVVSSLKEHPAMKNADLPATDQDKSLVRFLLHEHIDYNIRDDIRKKTGIKEEPYHATLEERRAWFNKLGELTENQVSFILRRILLSKYSTHLPQQSGGTALRILGEALGDVNIGKLEADQQEIAAKRNARVDKRIAELQAKKKELLAASKPEKAEKKKSPKKSIQ